MLSNPAAGWSSTDVQLLSLLREFEAGNEASPRSEPKAIGFSRGRIGTAIFQSLFDSSVLVETRVFWLKPKRCDVEPLSSD